LTAQELGKIEKPPAERFAGKRKIYLIPLIFPESNAPEGYGAKASLYWEQVTDQVRNLEARTGPVRKVYHEFLSESGEEGLKALEKSSQSSHQLVREKCANGAQMEAMEDRALLEEMMDWERCLLIGFVSQKVAQTVSESYAQASNQRNEHIAKRIDETLQEDEAALLLVSEGHRVQFPQDIEVFYVNPPALDEIHRWLREQRTEAHKAQQEAETEEADK
jgi:hypothetical protein